MAKNKKPLNEGPLLDRFIEDFSTPQELADAIALAKARRAKDLLFDNVVRGIRAQRYQGKITLKHLDGPHRGVVSEMHGATATMVFNSEDDVRQFIEQTYPPELAAWKRMAQLMRMAMADPMVVKSPNAVAFLELVFSLANHARGDQDQDEVIEPLTQAVATRKAKRIRKLRTDTGSAKVKDHALALYKAGNFISVAAAARGIFKDVQQFAESLKNQQRRSPDRFEKTLREWLKDSNK